MEVRGGFALLARPERGLIPSKPQALRCVSSHSALPAARIAIVISPELLEVLACPKCKQKIELSEDGQALVCQADRLRYPIVDGIPVMLIEEAASF